ncbi:MAG: alpha-galactosidase [Treponema sp.]|nr:alpha-galactosidase [Treponema sp.]
MTPTEPAKITDKKFRFDSFNNNEVFEGNKKGRLPAMGWNSWNAFGSGNTEALTKAMADKIVELGLNKLGYKYVVLDDGCYKSERENGKLANEPIKFPSGFSALSDYVHKRGLKFGMYNDIGTNLCAGAAVGTCGFEKTDAKSYIDWGVDFLKIDNCYYLWDNATFSNPENAKYVFAPNLRQIQLKKGNFCILLNADKGILEGRGASLKNGFATCIGTFDGTNTGTSPVGPMSGELVFDLEVPEDGEYELIINYATARQNGTGEWLQIAAGQKDSTIFFDNLLPATEGPETFTDSKPISITLHAGHNKLRLMNHRRQENTLCSYAAMLEGLNEAKPDHGVLLSLCEWGKTQPQNWGYKVGNSWRILNDITFRVGSDRNPGFGNWTDPGTPSVTSQYNKAVIMDEFSGLDKGWNDPDMLMVGMEGMTTQMSQTHFTMWCMMNSPLMLGLDLRRVQKGDELYNIIANKDLIALNQDALGIQAKRIFTTAEFPEDLDNTDRTPDRAYITDCDRVDILAKPLADGSLALSFFNLSQEKKCGKFAADLSLIKKYLANKLPASFYKAKDSRYNFINLWTGQKGTFENGLFQIEEIEACCNITLKISPVEG